MEKQLSERTNGGTNDFESLMEESLKAPRSGDVLVGRVLLVTRDNVIIDINYKCEGQVPLAEFLDHEGKVAVKEGDEVDVYFEGTETENGTVMLSHAKAEKFKIWRELERAFQDETPVEGVILGKVRGGQSRRQSQSSSAEVRPVTRTGVAGHETNHARSLDQSGRELSGGRTLSRQGRERHRLRCICRTRKRCRGTHPRFRDDLEQT